MPLGLSEGAWIAIAVAVLSSTVTVGVTTYVQRRQDRREKRQGVHASFKRALMAANTVAGLTAPLQFFGSGEAWTADLDMSEEERRRFYATLEALRRDVQDAVVELTLEGIAKPVDAVEEMSRKFLDFRERMQRVGTGRSTESDWREAEADAQDIATLREQLQHQLPTILAGILPDRLWLWRWPRSLWSQ